MHPRGHQSSLERWLCGTAVAWYRLVVGTAIFLSWDVIHRQSSCTAGAACLVLLFLQGWGDGVCPSGHLSTEPQPSSVFPISSCFPPHPLSTFISSQPLSIPFSSSFPPGSSICVKVHVHSVPTRFSPPTLVPLPCPELPKGDKCIEHSLLGRGQWAGEPCPALQALLPQPVCGEMRQKAKTPSVGSLSIHLWTSSKQLYLCLAPSADFVAGTRPAAGTGEPRGWVKPTGGKGNSFFCPAPLGKPPLLLSCLFLVVSVLEKHG